MILGRRCKNFQIFIEKNLFLGELGIIFAKNLVITKQMGDLKKIICEVIHNKGGFVFHKLCQGKSCQFDDFLTEIGKNPQYKAEWAKIVRWMEAYGAIENIPSKHYRIIRGLKRTDIYEYRSKSLRVYVKVDKPDVIIVIGGYKKNQKQDINNLKYKLKEVDLL